MKISFRINVVGRIVLCFYPGYQRARKMSIIENNIELHISADGKN